MPNENDLLVITSPDHKPEDSLTRNAIELLKAFPDGMAKTYATFGPVAILYKPGFWLIGPVLTGGVISLSDKTFEFLEEHYPENELVKFIGKMSKTTNQTFINFFEDFGFTFSLITAVAAQIGGVKYYTNIFAQLVAPIVSLLPSAAVSHARYRQANNLENGQALNIFTGTLRGAYASTSAIGTLQLSNIIPEVSAIPSSVIITSALVGFFGKVAQNSWPIASLIMETLVETLENLSLGAAFFAFPNDIYAAANDDEISDDFFYTNAAISLFYFLILLGGTGYLVRDKYRKLGTSTEQDEANSNTQTENLIPVINFANDEDEQNTTDSVIEIESSDEESFDEPPVSPRDTPRPLARLSYINANSYNNESEGYSSSESGDENNDVFVDMSESSQSQQSQLVSSSNFFKPRARSLSTDSFFNPGNKERPKIVSGM